MEEIDEQKKKENLKLKTKDAVCSLFLCHELDAPAILILMFRSAVAMRATTCVRIFLRKVTSPHSCGVLLVLVALIE